MATGYGFGGFGAEVLGFKVLGLLDRAASERTRCQLKGPTSLACRVPFIETPLSPALLFRPQSNPQKPEPILLVPKALRFRVKVQAFGLHTHELSTTLSQESATHPKKQKRKLHLQPKSLML